MITAKSLDDKDSKLIKNKIFSSFIGTDDHRTHDRHYCNFFFANYILHRIEYSEGPIMLVCTIIYTRAHREIHLQSDETLTIVSVLIHYKTLMYCKLYF